jgi:hypothetical protein
MPYITVTSVFFWQDVNHKLLVLWCPSLHHSICVNDRLDTLLSVLLLSTLIVLASSTVITEVETAEIRACVTHHVLWRLKEGFKEGSPWAALIHVIPTLRPARYFYHNIFSTFYSAHRDGAQPPAMMNKSFKDWTSWPVFKGLVESPRTSPNLCLVYALAECPNTSAVSSTRMEVLALLEDLIASHLQNCVYVALVDPMPTSSLSSGL